MTPDEKRRLRACLTRHWHERRTVNGLCHRCPRRVEEAGWYCRRCRRELAQQKAFLTMVRLLAEGRCTECRRPNPDRAKWRCRRCRAKVLNTRSSSGRSLQLDASRDAARAVGGVRPASRRLVEADSDRAVAV